MGTTNATMVPSITTTLRLGNIVAAEAEQCADGGSRRAVNTKQRATSVLCIPPSTFEPRIPFAPNERERNDPLDRSCNPFDSIRFDSILFSSKIEIPPLK